MVALFGPTEPRRTGPYGRLDEVLRMDLPCAPCLSDRCASPRPNECLTLIPPQRVLERVRRLLTTGPGVNQRFDS
jgi:ADP-heptose:LPS heptosyltransferase